MAEHKVVIIGSGPAGYTAGVYVARAQLAPLLYAGYKAGGQLMWTTDIENYPGFPQGTPGPQLMTAMREQAERFGTTISDQFVTAVDFSARPFKIWTNLPADFDPETHQFDSPAEFETLMQKIKSQAHATTAEAVIVATGASSIMLGIAGEQEYLGKGVSTCAVCDAAFFRDKDTVVVGGGDAAMEDTLALTKFAKSVTVIHRRDNFRASKVMQERVLNHKKVQVLWNSNITKIVGEDKVEGVVVQTTDPQTKSVTSREMAIDGVFVAIGHRPSSQLFQQSLELDAHGYILTRQSLSQQGVTFAQNALTADGLVTFPTMTSVPGVFAAGDVVDIRYKQAITAAGQGCQAALDAERWLESEAYGQ